MKKILQGVVEWKTRTCLLFTGTVILSIIIGLFFDTKAIEISMLLSILLISAIGTFIQFLAFTDFILKKTKYSIRIVIFVIPFSLLLFGCALIFNWFPTEYMGSWIISIGIFVLAFIGITVGYEVYFRITGKKYDGILGQYKKSKDDDK